MTSSTLSDELARTRQPTPPSTPPIVPAAVPSETTAALDSCTPDALRARVDAALAAQRAATEAKRLADDARTLEIAEELSVRALEQLEQTADRGERSLRFRLQASTSHPEFSLHSRALFIVRDKLRAQGFTAENQARHSERGDVVEEEHSLLTGVQHRVCHISW